MHRIRPNHIIYYIFRSLFPQGYQEAVLGQGCGPEEGAEKAEPFHPPQLSRSCRYSYQGKTGWYS